MVCIVYTYTYYSTSTLGISEQAASSKYWSDPLFNSYQSERIDPYHAALSFPLFNNSLNWKPWATATLLPEAHCYNNSNYHTLSLPRASLNPGYERSRRKHTRALSFRILWQFYIPSHPNTTLHTSICSLTQARVSIHWASSLHGQKKLRRIEWPLFTHIGRRLKGAREERGKGGRGREGMGITAERVLARTTPSFVFSSER